MANRNIRIQGECQCGNNDPSKFYIIRGEHELWGVCCKRRNCGAEYLIKAFVDQEETSIVVNNQRLYYNPPIWVALDPEFQVRLSHERVVNVADLKPGDHVGFRRWYFIWHHAIVVEAQAHPFRLVIDSWDGSYSRMKRMRREVQQDELERMYKFNYSDEIERRNPPELVLARSESRLHPYGENAGCVRPWVLGETSEHYGFFNENCEHFATYCKTGRSYCNQSSWLWAKIKEAGKAFCSGVFKVTIREALFTMAPEALENMTQFVLGAGSQYLFEGIGLIGVVGAELYCFSQAHTKLKMRLQNGEISREVYHTELGKKLVEFLLVIVIAGGGGLVVAFFGTPLMEVVLAPILVLVAKGASYLVTYALGDRCLSALARSWEWVGRKLDDIKNFLVDKFRQCVEWCKEAWKWIKNKVCEVTNYVCTKVEEVTKCVMETFAKPVAVVVCAICTFCSWMFGW